MPGKRLKKDRMLYFDNGRILDEYGNTVELAEAKRRWLAGEVKDWNLSMQRLAGFDFDIARLNAFYEKQRRAQGGR